MKNKIIIISSPSGAGKTTVCNHLLKKNKNIILSISYTTRPIRNSEKCDLWLVSAVWDFIETAKVFDYLYGSPINNVNKAFKMNKSILFDIDWQGAKKLRKKFNNSQIIDFFILPPNKIELKNRLQKRGRDNKTEIKKRLSLAVSEIKHFNEYKYVIINYKINKTVNILNKIINHHFFIDKIHQKINNYKIN